MSAINIILDIAGQGNLSTSVEDLEKVRDALKAITAADKARIQASMDSARELREAAKAAKDSLQEEEKAAKEAAKMQNAAARDAAKAQAQAAKEQAKAAKEALSLAEKQRAAEEKKQAQLRAESTLIGKLQKQLREQKAIVQGAFDVKTIEAANREIQRLSREMNNMANVGRQSSNTFGTAFSSFQFKFNFLGNLASDVALKVGEAALKVAADVVLIPAAFDKAADELQAITGASAQDIEFYKKAAAELGPAVGKSATEVLKAYQLIGGAKPELLKDKEALASFTESVITLSKAGKEDLPQAAGELTDAMNQFGASAEESNKYINALAAGAKEGAAEIPDITEALLKFGVAAKSSNVSVEESIGLIETLAEKGLKGAEAGTALRNVLAKISAPDTLGKSALGALKTAGVNIKILSDNTLPLSRRLEELGKIQGNNSAIVRVFGLENKNAAQILIENRKRTEELTKAVTGTSAAYEMAAKNTDNLDGSLAKASASYESFILALNDGDGAIAKLARGSVDLLTAGFLALAESMKSVAQLEDERRKKAIASPVEAFGKRYAQESEIKRKAEIYVIENKIISDKKRLESLQKQINENNRLTQGSGRAESRETLKLQEKVKLVKDYIAANEQRLATAKKIEAQEAAKPAIEPEVKLIEAKAKEAKRIKTEALDQAKLDESRLKIGVQIAENQRELNEQLAKDPAIQNPEKIAKLRSEIEAWQKLLVNTQKPDASLTGIFLSDKDRAASYRAKRSTIGEDLKDWFKDNVDAIVGLAQQVNDQLDKVAQRNIERIEKQKEAQAGILDTQRDLAKAGLANTLAFEQERAAKLEAQRIEEQKRQEKREKRMAFFNALASYSKEQPETALGKALALVTLANAVPIFEKGGLVADGSTASRAGIGGNIQNGIFQGRSHRRGGILIEAEGREGILSRREMGALGRENFFALKDALNQGNFSDMLANSTQQMIMVSNPAPDKSDEIIYHLKELGKKIENMPHPSAAFDELGNFISTINQAGSKKTTIYMPNKRNW